MQEEKLKKLIDACLKVLNSSKLTNKEKLRILYRLENKFRT